MAGTLTIKYLDAQNEEASNSFTVTDTSTAATAVPKFKALTNAKITSATYSEIIDISGLSSNTAVAANNESCRTKAAVTLTGPNPTTGLNRISSTLEIPAPLGSLISGAPSDVTNALLTTLLTSVLGNRGETLDEVTRIDYAR